MELFFTSFVAGILTILAPCVLPVLPLIVGGAVREGETKSLRRPLIIIVSLVISIVLFTIILRASTILIDVPEQFWRTVSGIIIVFFGTTMIWPSLWDQISLKLGLVSASNRMLARASSKKGVKGDILIGAALGPVFTSCSPTYGLILATVLPVSLAQGTLYLIAYSMGLAIMLLGAAFLGGKLITKLGWVTRPHSKFRRILGAMFIALGLAFVTGLDRDFQTWLIDIGVYDPISNIEQNLPK